MRNPIIEATIDEVIEKSLYTADFKNAFKQFVKNKFDHNAKEGDLKRVLSILDIDVDMPNEDSPAHWVDKIQEGIEK